MVLFSLGQRKIVFSSGTKMMTSGMMLSAMTDGGLFAPRSYVLPLHKVINLNELCLLSAFVYFINYIQCKLKMFQMLPLTALDLLLPPLLLALRSKTPQHQRRQKKMSLMWKSPIKIRMKLKVKSRMKVPFNKWYYTIICTPKRVQPNCDLDCHHDFFVGCIVFGWHFHLPFCSQVINKSQKEWFLTSSSSESERKKKNTRQWDAKKIWTLSMVSTTSLMDRKFMTTMLKQRTRTSTMSLENLLLNNNTNINST